MKSVKIKSTKNKIEIEFQISIFLTTTSSVYGWLFKICWGKKMDIKKFVNVMQSKKRELCAPPAPPQGLI